MQQESCINMRVAYLKTAESLSVGRLRTWA